MLSFIVKADDDLRQEQLAMQLIDEFAQEFRALPLAPLPSPRLDCVATLVAW